MLLQVVIPPMPYYLNSGEAVIEPGGCHPARKHLGVFDLLVVTRGALYLTENGESYRISKGEALLLFPDGYHYAHRPCEEQTHFYWVHFNHVREWKTVPDDYAGRTDLHERRTILQNQFTVHVMKYGRLSFPEHTYMRLDELLATVHEPSGFARFREQSQFHEIFQLLRPAEGTISQSTIGMVAEKAAYYLRRHYTEQVSYKQLGEEMNYHPTYISRCMKQVYQCTPLEYLNQYRLEQARFLLVNSDYKVSQIAEKVGFPTIPYFTKCFKEQVRMSPREFRNKFQTMRSGTDAGISRDYTLRRIVEA